MLSIEPRLRIKQVPTNAPGPLYGNWRNTAHGVVIYRARSVR